jgi:molybdopterin molybdotransferase
VAILSSGDELHEPGAALPAGGVYDANRYILKALLAPLPVEVTDLGILRDDAAASRKALMEAARAHHLVLASGGASRGEADHVVASVAREGKLGFWQIRMKPGRPLAAGRMGDAVFVGLPGNPVAATVCFLLFARPLLMALAGAPWTEPVGYPLPAAFAFERKPGRTELLRARLATRPDGTPEVHRIAREGSGILTSLTDAQGLVVVPEATSRITPGELVTYMSFAELGLPG